MDHATLSIHPRNLTIHASRPCVGTRLIHKSTLQSYIIIGVHYDHFVPVKMVQEGIRTVLLNLQYDYSNDKVIIMGDHNEFYGCKGSWDGNTLTGRFATNTKSKCNKDKLLGDQANKQIEVEVNGYTLSFEN